MSSSFVTAGIAPTHTGRLGRPAKHGKHLSIENDFMFSGEKIGDYYTGIRRGLTKIFGNREVLAYSNPLKSCNLFTGVIKYSVGDVRQFGAEYITGGNPVW